MTRVRIGSTKRQKHNKVLKAASGFYGVVGSRYRLAKQKTFRAGVTATRDRKARKRQFRQLWIIRLSAACQQRGIRYSQFIGALFDANIALNRKVLSELAIADPAAFDAVVASTKLASIAKPMAAAPTA